MFQIGAKRVAGHPGDRNHPLLAALAKYPRESLGQTEVSDIESREFAYAQTASVEDFEYRAVAQSCGIIRERLGHQPVDVVDRDDVRQTLWDSGQRQPFAKNLAA